MLELTYRAINTLTSYSNNSRTHNNKQIKQIADSIEEFGFTNPILIDENNGVIAGHGRIEAAKTLNIEEVPTITLENLSDEQKAAYVIADNKLALNAGWDENLLLAEINRLEDLNYNISLIGFDVEELDALKGMPDFDAATEDEQGKLDELEPKIVICPKCGEEFDLRET
jgi:ParB-like chromosome segregation protein Spo0J